LACLANLRCTGPDKSLRRQGGGDDKTSISSPTSVRPAHRCPERQLESDSAAAHLELLLRSHVLAEQQEPEGLNAAKVEIVAKEATGGGEDGRVIRRDSSEAWSSVHANLAIPARVYERNTKHNLLVGDSKHSHCAGGRMRWCWSIVRGRRSSTRQKATG
jgi:hypothetical protein